MEQIFTFLNSELKKYIFKNVNLVGFGHKSSVKLTKNLTEMHNQGTCENINFTIIS